MIQLLPQSDSLSQSNTNPTDAVKHINEYIENNSCEKMSIDISFMNVLDACYVSTLCSAKHYIKYPKGKINWKISSELIKEFNKDFDLGNMEYFI